MAYNTKSQTALDKLNKKYGLQSTTTKYNSTKGNQSDKGKQSNSASSTRTSDIGKTKSQANLDKLNKKYGLGSSSTATNNKQPTKGTTSTTKTNTQSFKDYASAVKYLNDNGIKGASGIMTENEWRRRKSASGHTTYQSYLNDAVKKFSTGNIGGNTSTKQPQGNSNDAQIEELLNELTAKRIKYTDEYWNNVQKEVESRLRKQGLDSVQIMNRSWGEVQAQKAAWEKEEEEILKKVRKLGGVRDATWYDATIGSLKRGYQQSRFGEETFDKMMGKENEADALNKLLQSEEYQFEADGALKEGISGAAELIGQMGYTFTKPKTWLTVGQSTLAGAGTAFALGQAGPQALAPEEALTVPVGAVVGFKTGMGLASAENALKIEGGHAYNEMIENGISHDTAKKIALAVGTVNAGLEMLQTDQLLDAFKVLSKSGVTQTFAERLLTELLERGVDVAIETAQEVAQEGVTMGGTEIAHRIDKGEGLYTWGDVRERLGDTVESSALSFGMMNVPAATFNVATSQAKTVANHNAQQTEYAESIAKDDEALTTLIEEGKASGEGSASAKIAAEVEQAKANGTLTTAQVKKLINSNDRVIQGEENVARTERVNSMQTAIKDLGYGEHGTREFTDIFEHSDERFEIVRKEFQAAYELGYTNPNFDSSSFTDSNTQRRAFNAGKLDYNADLIKRKAEAKNTVVYGKESGFYSENAPSDVKQWEIDATNTMAKMLRTKAVWADELKGNAEIIKNKGVVLINKDFQRYVGDRKVGLVYHAAHEMAVHRAAELAPKEMMAFANALYRYLSKDVPQNRATLAMRYKSGYKAQDVNLSVAEAIEEVNAYNILELYHNDERALAGAMQKIAEGNNQAAKSGMQKFIDVLNEILESLREFVNKLTGKEKAEAKADIDELTRLRDMFENAIRVAAKNAEQIAAKNGQKTTDTTDQFYGRNVSGVKTETEGDVTHSLKVKEASHITADMSDSDRTKIISAKTIVAPVYEGQADAAIKENLEDLNGGQIGLVKTALITIGEQFGVIGSDIKIEDVDVDIRFSKSNLRESVSKKATPTELAKLIPVLKEAVANAIGIERHDNRYYYDTTTVFFENLLGGFADGEYFVPVRFGLKHSKTGEATLYVVVDQNRIPFETLEKLKKTEVVKTTAPLQKEAATSASRSVNYTLSQIIPYVKSKDLLRYIPDNMLDKEQKTAKWEAIAETIKTTAEKNDKKYKKYISEGKLYDAQRMVEAAARANGYVTPAYHGTPNKDFTVFDKERVGQGTDQYGAGFYFASNKDAARSYGERVIDSRLSINNPIKLNGSSDEGVNLIDGGYDYLLTEEQAYEVIKRLPNIYDSEESILGDYYDSYWENGAEEWMIEDLASNEFNRNIGGLDSDLFRNYPNELHEAIRDVVGYDGVEVAFDNGDKFYVAWFDNQMKSADTITYDDNGNVIPLSERFNEDNPDIRYSLKNLDTEYLKLAENPKQNDAKLREMVYDAALDAGLKHVGLHGTDAFGFTTFNKDKSAKSQAFFFTNKYRVAGSYSGVSGITRLTSKASQGNYETALDITKPLTIDCKGSVWNNIPYDIGKKGRVTTDDVVAYAKKNGYDSVIFNNLLDPGNLLSDADEQNIKASDKERKKWTSTVYAVFEPEQIKSLDPVTYDDKGKVIPLSERFNKQNKDIRYSLKDSDGNTLTNEQSEYFKDSKVRDENGNLLVMYQGAAEDFTVFDRKKSKYSNMYGRGFYFTESEHHASRYGKTRAYYLDIKHPVSTTETTITKTQLRKFLEAVAANEDYSFENYGYSATVDSVLQSTYGKSDFLMLYDVSQTSIGDLVEAVELFNEVNGTDYDGIILDTETVTFNSEQAKLTTNKKPTRNPDTRFSLKQPVEQTKNLVAVHNMQLGIKYLEYEAGNEDARLEALNSLEDAKFSLKNAGVSVQDYKDLAETVEHLKAEFELTKFAKADQKKLTKMTRDILKEYNSKADFDETFKGIDELYVYMANGEDGHPAVWDDVYSRAYNIAQQIVENALVVDDYNYQEYKDLRNYLRNTPMRFYAGHDSVPSGYENFNEFRKMNMGRLKFTKDGLAIDTVYQELASMYPEFFNEEEQTNTSDQLEQIINVLDEMQPTEVNPFDGDIEQATMYLANDLTSRFFDIPQAKPTFADKAERRVVAERIKGGKKVETVREQKDAKIKKLIESQRNKTKKLLEKAKESKTKAVAKEKAKRKDSLAKMSEKQKVRVLRARIERHTSALSKKLLNPTDKQHIPYELRGAVDKLLECINLESNYSYDAESDSYKKNDEGLPTKRTQAFHELQKVYADIASSVVVDPDLMGESGLLSGVISLADKRIVDMNSSELDTIWQAIRAIEASVNTANRVFSEGKFVTILEVAEALKAQNEGRKSKTELKGIAGKGQKLATLDMLTPETYLHYLGDAGDSIFRMMRNAQDKHISIMKEVSDFTHDTLKDVKINSLEKTIHTVKLGGEEVQLSTAQIMELYVLMKRKQAVEHIMVGGILPDVIDGKGLKKISKTKPVRGITAEEISSAISQLTDEQKKVADELQKYVSTVLSAYGNEASMQVYNYEKFNEENYWTIRTNRQEIKSDVDKDTAVTSVANKGMTKATKPHANTSVRIGSIFDTFASHSSDMATYAAWLGTSEDVNRIRNFVFWDEGARTGTVKEILDTVHGTQGSEYFSKLLTDLAIGIKSTDKSVSADNLIGHYKAASVGANLRVVIQQPTAIIRALDMIDARYLVGTANPLKGWEKAKKYAPIAQWKDWGYFDINTGRQMKDILFDNANWLEKTKQVGMWGASMADSLSWGSLWNAVEAETKAIHKELTVGSETYYETVAKRFTEIVDHTQVVDGILQRSQIMRDAGTFKKMATSFMGEPTKQYNMAISAYNDYKTGERGARKEAAARLGRTALALAVAGIVNACVQSIIDAMRDDDKEEKYWERWLTALVGDGEESKWYDSNLADTVNPLNYIPFAKDVVSIMQGYDVKRMDTDAITKVFDATKNMYKAVTGTGKYTIAEASAQLFVEIARMFGLSVANVKRDVKSLAMAIAIETDNYLMQYRMEKAMLDINYSYNSKNFIDILFNAYNNDREAYETIYKDMLKSGYDADTIQSGMETRMLKAEEVESVSDLTKRYMSPDNEKKYDSSMSRIKSSKAWNKASLQQQKKAKANLYEYLTSTAKDMQEMRTEARANGVDATEYTLWNLAIEMVDQPTGQEGSGSYDSKEKAEALRLINLGDKESAYFFGRGMDKTAKEELRETLEAGIDIQEYIDFKAATSDMKADKNAKGNSIPNSKKRKIVNYMNDADLTREEWNYFYYEIMGYKK